MLIDIQLPRQHIRPEQSGSARMPDSIERAKRRRSRFYLGPICVNGCRAYNKTHERLEMSLFWTENKRCVVCSKGLHNCGPLKKKPSKRRNPARLRRNLKGK